MEAIGGHLLVRCLEAQDVRAAFGVPGESYLAVLDALHDSPIEFVTCRQEGGAAYAASAWGRLTSQPGIALVTRGPGATNASVGLHTAMQDSSPVILFIGQASMEHLGREAFQEVDYRAFFGPLVKWATQIESVDRIPEIVSRAFSVAQSGRPGPVVISLPEDVLSGFTNTDVGKPVVIPEPAPSAEAVSAAASLLSASERPVIVAGYDRTAHAGRGRLAEFAEANQVPVLTTFRGNDLIDNHSSSFAGAAGVGMANHVEALIRESDLVLALGVRFDEMMTKAYTLFAMPDAAQKIVHVHASDGELGKVVQADVAVQSTAANFLRALNDVDTTVPAGRIEWFENARAQQTNALAAAPSTDPLDMSEVMAWLQHNVPDDVIFTNGAGNFSRWPNKHFAYGHNARLLGPESGSMGYGLPAAIAAKVDNPDRMAVAFVGDGDLQMTIQELGTATQAGAQPIVLVFNNATYGTIRMHQEREHPGRVSGTDLWNPDFVAIGNAYGFHSEAVSTTADFAPAFERAAASTSGALLELKFPAGNL